MIRSAEDAGYGFSLPRGVIAVNDEQFERLLRTVAQEYNRPPADPSREGYGRGSRRNGAPRLLPWRPVTPGRGRWRGLSVSRRFWPLVWGWDGCRYASRGISTGRDAGAPTSPRATLNRPPRRLTGTR